MTEPSRINAFSVNPLDRQSELRDENSVTSALAEDGAQFHLFAEEKIVFGPLFDRASATALGADFGRAVLLGRLDGVARLAVPVSPAAAEAAGLTIVDLRTIAVEGRVPTETLGPLAQAKSLLDWNARHGFCARCGHATRMALGGYRRDCDSCEAQHFPRTDPVVIMLVTDGDRALLGRNARFVTNVYSALAGFVEPGETIEDAVRREIREEAGLRVGAVRYHSSQPWPFPSSLMIGCIAELAGGELVIDHNELEDARWFDRCELASMLERSHPDGLLVPPPVAIAHYLVRAFLDQGPPRDEADTSVLEAG